MPIACSRPRPRPYPQVTSCLPRVHHRGRRRHQIPIALAAQPVPNFPRLRALALFGRRSVERAEPFSCRRPKTCTTAQQRTSLWLRLLVHLCVPIRSSAFVSGASVSVISALFSGFHPVNERQIILACHLPSKWIDVGCVIVSSNCCKDVEQLVAYVLTNNVRTTPISLATTPRCRIEPHLARKAVNVV